MRSLLLALVVLAACDTRVVADSSPGLVCRHAGGACVVSTALCGNAASSSVDDCNPDLDSAGDFCCLDGDDAGVVEAGGAPAGTACTQGGGRCLLGGFTCTTVAADPAQDCNPDRNPGGAFCCQDAADAAP